ncbi:MAG TPA: amidohydrolase family protein, partial [Tahibacter sp.]|nr:amidohydrolase family protein [Tahibacter sp.]
MTLGESTRANDVLLKPQVAQHLALETNRFPSNEYPGSIMGAVALIRQTFLDTRWQHDRLAWQGKHRDAERLEANLALDALEAPLAGRQPVVFSTDDELDYARVLALAGEFKLKLILAGNGHEYRDVARIKAAGVPVIVPLAYPDAPAVEDPDRALDLGLSDLEHWESAPFNARMLAEAGVPFALTSSGLKKPEEQFWANLRKAVASGLDEDFALAALTVQPATMLGASDRLGTLEAGKLAQIVVADADLFRSDKARIYETWIDGKRYATASLDTPDPRGTWNLRWTGASGPASIEISGDLPDLTAKAGDKSFPAIVGDRRLTLYPPGDVLGVKRERVAVVLSLTGAGVEGRGQLDGAREFRVDGTLASAKPRVAEAAKAKPALPLRERRYPFGEFGRTAPPAAQSIVVRHATIWTQGPQGKLEDADIAIANGKIVAVGKGVKAPAGAVEIDGRGKHVAPGIIDTHSHMAVSKGVNEASHAVTSEVRIGDALDPTDISIYRLLAGGVTSAQLLHGSANPIGGQSQIIKLRWGSDADGLRFEGAPPSIKFALGENVKQSNWGDLFTKRYPQTRMGVEQIDIDAFVAAQAYGEALAKQGKSGEPVRRDLRLETLWEILQKKRFVHIHSYRQDEILAFVRISERFGIVPVFQHILEGYKVADAMAKIGAGASGFSDWWAYKMEVADAIPYNGALMAKQGVVASFNS